MTKKELHVHLARVGAAASEMKLWSLRANLPGLVDWQKDVCHEGARLCGEKLDEAISMLVAADGGLQDLPPWEWAELRDCWLHRSGRSH